MRVHSNENITSAQKLKSIEGKCVANGILDIFKSIQ